MDRITVWHASILYTLYFVHRHSHRHSHIGIAIDRCVFVQILNVLCPRTEEALII